MHKRGSAQKNEEDGYTLSFAQFGTEFNFIDHVKGGFNNWITPSRIHHAPI